MTKKEEALRFGGEFGTKRGPNTKGVGLSTFKSMVWISNLGGLTLCAIALELFVVQQSFGWGLFCLIAGVIIAIFPSNYEIVGMEEDAEEEPRTQGESKENLGRKKGNRQGNG